MERIMRNQSLIYIAFLLGLQLSLYSAIFDFTDGNGTNPYIETVEGVILSAVGENELAIADLGGFGGSSGNACVTSAAGAVTFSFSQPINVQNILVAHTNPSTKTIVIAPNVGDNVTSNALSQHQGQKEIVYVY